MKFKKFAKRILFNICEKFVQDYKKDLFKSKMSDERLRCELNARIHQIQENNSRKYPIIRTQISRFKEPIDCLAQILIHEKELIPQHFRDISEPVGRSENPEGKNRLFTKDQTRECR